jgi:hypothetical protein
VAEGFDGDWLELREPFDAARATRGWRGCWHRGCRRSGRICSTSARGRAACRAGSPLHPPAACLDAGEATRLLMERAFDDTADAAEVMGWRAPSVEETLLVHHAAWAPGGSRAS